MRCINHKNINYKLIPCDLKRKMDLRGGQDFTDVVIRKKAPKPSELKDAAQINRARRDGVAVETTAKSVPGCNKHVPATAKSAHKLEAETEDFHHQRVPSTLKAQISKARADKKWTQADLARAIYEKPQVVQEYESGKAIPNGQVLSKMSRVLGVQLKAK